MVRDPTVASHIAQSKAKIEQAAPETVTAERHIDRTQRALERSRDLLDVARDPLDFTKPMDDAGRGAIEDRSQPAAKKPARRKAKAKRRR